MKSSLEPGIFKNRAWHKQIDLKTLSTRRLANESLSKWNHNLCTYIVDVALVSLIPIKKIFYLWIFNSREF